MPAGPRLPVPVHGVGRRRQADTVPRRTGEQQPILDGGRSETSEAVEQRPGPERDRAAVLVADQAELVRVAEGDADDVVGLRRRRPLAAEETRSADGDI